MKVRSMFLIVLLLSLSAPGNFGQTANIRAWNIQWLGLPSSKPGNAKNLAQKAADLADCIIAICLDVLGLEEISDDDGVSITYTNKSERFSTEDAYSNGTRHPQSKRERRAESES
jgi:hypothetical protein